MVSSIYRKFVKTGTGELFNILSAIKDGRFSGEITNVRELVNQGNNEGADNLKKQLWAFTPCGTFKDSRKAQSLQSYSQLVILDYDNVPVEEHDQVFKNIISDATTYSAFRSPSGKGIKAIVKVDSEAVDHGEAFIQVKRYYEGISGHPIDGSGKDISRLCYVSYDENLYLNEDSQIFKVKIPTVEVGVAVMEKVYNSTPTIEIEDIDRRFKMVRDFTDNKERYFEGNRNNYVHQLACNANRAGIPIKETLSSTLSEFGYDGDEVTSAVRSAYKNESEFGSDRHRYTETSSTYGVAEVSDVASVAQRTSATTKFLTFSEMAKEGETLAPLKKVFGNFILEKSLTLFPSERGVGKTLFAMQLAVSISNGHQNFLGEDLEVIGNVLYVNLELGEHTMKRRLGDLYKKIDKGSEYDTYCITSKQDLPTLKADIVDFCATHKPVLIIIDNLRTAFNGKDNEKNKEMASTIIELNQLKDQIGGAILLIHHTKKGTGSQITNSDMQSGAGAVSDLVDADFFLRRSGHNKNYRLLKRIKSRECEEQEGAKLIQLNPDNMWFEHIEDGVDESSHIFYVPRQNQEALKAKALELRENGIDNNAEIGRQLGVDRSTVKRWLDN